MAIRFETVNNAVKIYGTPEELKAFRPTELLVLKGLALAVKEKIQNEKEWLDRDRSSFTMVQFQEIKIMFNLHDYTNRTGSATYNNFTTEERVSFNEMVERKEKAIFAILQGLVEKGLVRKSSIKKNTRKNYYGRVQTAYYGFSFEGKNFLKSIAKRG